MASIIIPGAVQVRVRWAGASAPFLNVTHAVWNAAGPLSPTVGETIFAALKANAQVTAWMAYLPASTILEGVDVRDLRGANFPLLPSSSASVPGTAPAPAVALPPQSAIVLTLRTQFSGRAFRGRVYAGGLSSAADDGGGKILAAAGDQWRAFVVSLNNAIVSAGGTSLGIAQVALPARPGHGGTTLPARDAHIEPVTGYEVRDLIFDTQRRRTGAHIGSR